MNTDIEEIDSEDQVTCQLQIEETQLLADTATVAKAEPLDIEEIGTQEPVIQTPFPAEPKTADRPRSSTDWVACTSNTYGEPVFGGLHRTTSNANEAMVRRRGAGVSGPFSDLPRQLAQAVARLQSTRSMHNSLATSSLYNAPGKRTSQALRLKVDRLIYSCGNHYVEAEYENGEKYIVHIPSTLAKEGLSRGTSLLIEKPYTRRRLGDAWLVSLITAILPINHQ